jgi:hypothetical protein
MDRAAGHGAGNLESETRFDRFGGGPAHVDEETSGHRVTRNIHVPVVRITDLDAALVRAADEHAGLRRVDGIAAP